MQTQPVYGTTFDEDIEESNTNAKTCPECDGRVTTNIHETVCNGCGLVIDDQEIDHGPEWRDFPGEEETQARVGAPRTPARHDRGLSTTVGYKIDGTGRKLDNKTQRKFHRLRREHKRAKRSSKREQNCMKGLMEIRRIVGSLGLAQSLRDQACQLFQTAQDADLFQGRCLESMAAASVYIACRCNRQPRRLTDITAIGKVSSSRITNAYKVLNRELDIPVPPAKPNSYLAQFASELGVGPSIERHACDLASAAEDEGVANGRNPRGVAAACLYIAAEEREKCLTQKAVSEVANVSAVTIRQRQYELEELQIV